MWLYNYRFVKQLKAHRKLLPAELLTAMQRSPFVYCMTDVCTTQPISIYTSDARACRLDPDLADTPVESEDERILAGMIYTDFAAEPQRRRSSRSWSPPSPPSRRARRCSRCCRPSS